MLEGSGREEGKPGSRWSACMVEGEETESASWGGLDEGVCRRVCFGFGFGWRERQTGEG
jgi:hypothetical protein